MGRRRVSTKNEETKILSVRVPKSWVTALKGLETEDIKQHALLRLAIRRFLEAKKALA